MKAADRCREHFNGDRCTKTRGHASDLAIESDKEHVGAFVSWVGNGDAKRRISAPAPRRSRRAEQRFDRWLWRLDPASVKPDERPRLKALLDRIIADGQPKKKSAA